MKRIIIICMALAMVSGVSAQGAKSVGKIVDGFVKGAAIGAFNVKIPTPTIVTPKIKSSIPTKIPPLVLQRDTPVLQHILPPNDLHETLKRSAFYSYVADSITVTFTFPTDSTAICQVPDGTSWSLSRMKECKNAKPEEDAFKGQTVLGKGVYIFSKDYSILRFYSASDPTTQARTYKRE